MLKSRVDCTWRFSSAIKSNNGVDHLKISVGLLLRGLEEIYRVDCLPNKKFASRPSLRQILPCDIPPARLRHQNIVLNPSADGGQFVDELPVEAARVLVLSEGGGGAWG